jgi:hypothetical protein
MTRLFCFCVIVGAANHIDMTDSNIFELPRNIDRYLSALSKLYQQDGNRRLQELIVNARPRIHEGWSYDNWNGGTHGHALYLDIPEALFLKIVKEKDETQAQLKSDLNRVHNIKNEFIEEVFLELEPTEHPEWRKDSGLLVVGKRTVPPDAVPRIWGSEEYFRLFLSHKAQVKKETGELKDQLQLFGISAFVAHEDIHPTKAWQDEIEYALATMDGFVALMTSDFHESEWTDQEVGFAVARNVPMIAVRLGLNPYGFIGKFQALPGDWLTTAVDIARLLINNDRMFTSYLRAIRKCPSWDAGNRQAKVLDGFTSLTASQIDDLLAAYNETKELQGSFAFNGSCKSKYGPGLVHQLNRLGPRKFAFCPDATVEQVT